MGTEVRPPISLPRTLLPCERDGHNFLFLERERYEYRRDRYRYRQVFYCTKCLEKRKIETEEPA